MDLLEGDIAILFGLCRDIFPRNQYRISCLPAPGPVQTSAESDAVTGALQKLVHLAFSVSPSVEDIPPPSAFYSR